LSQGQGFEVEAEVKKEPNDWGGPAQAVMVGAWACTPLCLFHSSSCLPASMQRSKTTKTKQINPLDTTNIILREKKKGHSTVAYSSYQKLPV